jgi:hypothetical protein
MPTLGDEKPAEHNDHGRNDGRGIHPTPSTKLGHVFEDQIADRGADEGPEGLESKCSQHQAAAVAARNALGDDQMRRRIIAAEGDADSKQREHQQRERLWRGCRDSHEQAQEDNEDDHLGDEHRLAAEAIGQAAQEQRADQDAEETRGTDETVLGRADIELVGDQRQRHAGHEHHKAFEEFAGRREDEDAPLHCRHRADVDRGAVGPHRLLVDVGLD